MKPVTILWYGGGQDSTAILFKSVYDESFKEKFITGDLVVVCSDTGNEFPETYDYINEIVKPFCNSHKIHFTHITPDMGHHPKTWHSLQAQFEKNNRVMSVTFPKTCTDNLKIKPCYNYLEQYLKEKYGFIGNKPKSVFYEYVRQFGKLNVIIGFGADEIERIENNVIKKDLSPKFVKNCINKIYPLVDIGFSRYDCQQAIKNYGYKVPPPSNCMMCPFASMQEILYLYRAHPSEYKKWVNYEKKKLEKDNEKCKPINNGVKGNLTLVQYTKKAIAKYGHMTIKELKEYRFSHGHCVKSKY